MCKERQPIHVEEEVCVCVGLRGISESFYFILFFRCCGQKAFKEIFIFITESGYLHTTSSSLYTAF